MNRFIESVFFSIFIIAGLFALQLFWPNPIYSACLCGSQMCTTSSCGTTCYGYDPSQCANGVSCYPFPYCVCGYQGNGTCANPGCGPTPVFCVPGNCCDPNDVTKSTGSFCSASCQGSCNYWDNQTCGWTTASCNVPSNSTIKGYKVLMPSNQSQNSPPSTTTPYNLTIGIDAGSSNSNPYSVSVGSACVGAANHYVYAPVPLGYSVGYTKCDSSQANCPGNEIPPPGPLSIHNAIPTGAIDNSGGSGTVYAILNVSTPAIGSFADVWWHYCSTWTNSGPCTLNPGTTCGSGTQLQTDNCGNNRLVTCSVTCSFFQTFGGDVTFKGALSNSQMPSSSYYISNRY